MLKQKYSLSRQEQTQFDRDGYLVLPSLLNPDEVTAISTVVERLVARLAQARAGSQLQEMSQYYVFQIDALDHVVIKWEPLHTDVVQGVEPCAHLDPALRELADDPRLAGAASALLGVDTVSLYTEKVNVKRAGTGGAYALHQDYPYWVGVSEDADQVITASLAIDAADTGNGCLEVIPGSHRWGVVNGKQTDNAFESLEIDEETIDLTQLVPVEMPAGSLVLFGPRLVHRSGPNPSARDRRALLFSYQPAGRRPLIDYLRERSVI